MCRRLFSQQLTGHWIATLTVCTAASGAAAQTASPDSTSRGVFEVAANSVYVRSGGSLNHYPVCKLNAGDRVTVVGASGKWFEILPPAGTFSLVHGDYVDTADDKHGVINGDNVRVRAGSQLSDHKYTVQRLLSKGAEVTVLGRNPDGFVRILPPEGATLWISSEFLTPLRSGDVPMSSASETADGGGASPASPRPVSAAPTTTVRAPIATPVQDTAPGIVRKSMTPVRAPVASGTGGGVVAPSLQSLPATPEREMLSRIERDIEVELDKLLLERDFQPLIARLKAVTQSNDDFAKRYAEARAEQLKTMEEIADTVRTVRGLGEKTDARRLEFLAERTERSEVEVPKPSGIDARGVLRISALYPETRTPRRFRLVDSSSGTERTIAYVDVPGDVKFDPATHLDRYVGVRAGRKHLLPGAAEPIPVYVAKEIVLLDAPIVETMKTVQD